MKNISRRSALAKMALAPALLHGRQKGTAFALIGDRPHNPDYIRNGLAKTIGADSPMKVSIDYYTDVTWLDAEQLQGYKLLIMLRDGSIYPNGYGGGGGGGGGGRGGRGGAGGGSGEPAVTIVSDPPLPPMGPPEFWMKPDQGKAVRQFIENGGSALLLHNVTHIGLTNPDFRHVLGAAYAGHPPIRTFKVKVKNSNHPITKGVRDFVVTDEQHYMEYDKDKKDILLETVNEEGLDYRGQGSTAPGGWAYDYGKGRFCYFSPGHLITVLWNPEYVKLQQNAIRWLMRQG
jgi:Trehalose utilisation